MADQRQELLRGLYSFSQSGEDRIALFLLEAMRASRPHRYLDIGGAYPISHNNTYLFYVQGGSGVVIEGNASYAPMYEMHRGRDLLITAACVPKNQDSGRIDFHVSSDPGWSGISRGHVELAETLGKGPLLTTRTIPTITINEVLRDNFADQKISLLSIDVEGIDHDILAEMDTATFRPHVIIAENAEPGVRIHDAMLSGKGYLSYATTFVNSIYVDISMWNSISF